MDLKYEAIVRTRTADADYFWVGPDPTEWWIEGWGGSLLRREPCLLRQSGGQGGRILITGIQSDRRDGSTSRTRIRYDITFTPADEGPLSSRQVEALIRDWWGQRRLGQHEPWPLGKDLDAAISAAATKLGATADGLIESKDARTISQTLAAVADQKHPRSQPQEPLPPDDDSDWAGSGWPAAESVVALEHSRPVAYFASATPRQMGDHLGLPREAFIIVDGDDLLHSRPKRPAPANSPGQQPTKPENRSPMTKVLLIAVGAGAVIVAVYLVVRGLRGRD